VRPDDTGKRPFGPPRHELTAGARPVSRRRRWATVAGLVALTAFTLWAVWSAFHVDEYIAEALVASPGEAPNASRFPPATYAAAVSSVIMCSVVVLHLGRIKRWPSGVLLALVATAHSVLAAAAIVSVASLGT
jgi:cytochrome bd-type quinol oxidase subunit 2